MSRLVAIKLDATNLEVFIEAVNTQKDSKNSR